jgi:flagellar biosynthesis/type III secretory pathway chaperone
MSEDTRRRLENLLDREIDVARRLAATLEDERAVLTGPAPDEVMHQAAAKIDLLKAIERLEAERRALEVAADEPGIAAAAIADRWRTLMDLMRECRKANEVNGYIINTRQGQIQQLLGIVRGGGPVTYTAQGKTFNRALRALARA